MMKVINDVVFGLTWRPVKSTVKKAKAEAQKGKGRAKAICDFKSEKSDVIGISFLRLPKKCLSAAAICAKHSEAAGDKSAAYLFETSENEFVFIGAVDGAPAPGCDFIGSKEDAMSLFQEFYEVTSSMAPIAVYSTDDISIQGSYTFSFEKECERWQGKANTTEIEVKNQQGEIIALVAVAGVFVIAALGYWGNGIYQNHKEQERQLELARLQAAEAERRNNPLVQYEDALGSFVSTLVGGVDVGKLWNLISVEDLRRGSWIKEKISCDQNGCSEEWVPANKAHFKWSDWADANKAQAQLLFNEAKVVLSRPTMLTELPQSDRKLEFFGSSAMFIQWLDALESTKTGKLNVTAPSNLSSIPAVAGKPALFTREFSYEGPLWAIDIPTGIPGMSITKLQIETSKGTGSESKTEKLGTLKIEGVFYEKN